MSDTTGPISTLAGARHKLPDGTMCDDHPTVPAVARVQGETDSFGSELHDLCAECVAELQKHANDDRCGTCEWCKSQANDLRDRRDYDEGMCGRVYRVCGACVKQANQRAQEELDAYTDDYGDWDE